MKLLKALVLFFVLFGGEVARASCVNPVDYARSTAVIGKNLSNGSTYGTAWFYKDRKTLITAGHVARSIADKTWTKLEIRQREENATLVSNGYARIIKMGNIENATDVEIAALERYAKEDLAVMELGFSYSGAWPLSITSTRPAYYSSLLAIAYPSMRLSFANGRILPPGIEREIEKDFSSMIHIEVEGNRQQLTGGSSGSPVLNCEGEVVAILNLRLDDSYVTPKGEKIYRPVGTATNYALPSSFVEELILR